MKPLAITPGDPGGIGPDLCIRASIDGDLDGVVVADPDLIAQRAEYLNLPVKLETASAYDPEQIRGVIYIDPIHAQDATNPPGLSMVGNARYCLECIDHAISEIQAGQYSALVTGPVTKATIRNGGFPDFTGHTEYLRDYFGCDSVIMMLASSEIRVALVTTHLPLSEVPCSISKTKILTSADIVICAFQKTFQIPKPRIHILGLNPHAGENGHLGCEDNAVIRPAIHQLREHYPELYIEGPLPADTAFTPEVRARADVTIAMYHDQGLPVVKYSGFGESVNVTLGLPIIRTSVDHGTALELAGRGIASTGGLIAAMREAKRIGFPTSQQ